MCYSKLLQVASIAVIAVVLVTVKQWLNGKYGKIARVKGDTSITTSTQYLLVVVLVQDQTKAKY